jgi:hypothetical protein
MRFALFSIASVVMAAYSNVLDIDHI